MAIEKTIVINTDTSKAVKGVKDLNKEIKNTSKETKEVSESTKQLSGSLDSVTGGAVTKFKGMITAIKGMAVGFKGVGVAIAASGLGLLVVTIAAIKSAFTSSEEGQNKFAKIMGVIGVVTGNLIDLLSDLGEVIISAFENPKKSINSFAKLIKENIINRFEGLLELFPALGKAVKQFFKGDFSGAAETAANATAKVVLGVEDLTGKIKAATQATKDFIAEQNREAAIAEKIANKRASADKIDRQLIVERAEAERKIADLRDKASRRDIYNAQQRKQFLTEASDINEEITDKELFAARLRANAIVEENKLSKSTKEDKDKEAQALAKVIQLETKRLNLKKRLGTEISAINQQEKQAAETSRQTEVKRLESIDKIKQKFANSELEREAKTRQQKLDLEKQRAQEDLDLLIGSETEKKEAQLALDTLYAGKQKELDATIKDEKLEKEKEDNEKLKEEIQSLQDKRNEIAENEELNGAQKATMLLENLATELKINDLSKASMQEKAEFAANLLKASSAALGKETAAGKAAAIAATTIDTIQSGVSAYKGMVAAIPGPVGIAAGAVAAAGSLASGYASVKKILSVKTPGGGGGGSAPSGGASTPQAPAFNLVGQSGVNQVQDSLQEEQTPIRAFVVGAEVTSQQELDANQQNSASI